MDSVETDAQNVGTSPCSAREAHIKLSALNKATVKMAAQLKSIKGENETLQMKLEMSQSMNESESYTQYLDPNEAGIRGSLADNYQDHNKSQMLSAIVDLELRCDKLEKTIQLLHEENNQVRVQHEQEVWDLRGQLSDSDNRRSRIQHELVASGFAESKMKNVIRRLKDDRVHYRTTSEQTQSELCVVKQSLEKEEITSAATMKELHSLQAKHRNEMIAIDHARGLSKRSSSHVFISGREKKEEAAKTIQWNWKRTKAIRRQEKHQRETKDAVIYIQSVFQGHLTRINLLNSAHIDCCYGLTLNHCDSTRNVEESGDESDNMSESSEAVELLQSVMKGFLTRQKTLLALKNGTFQVEDGGEMQSSSDTDTLFSRIPSLSGYISTLPPRNTDQKQNISEVKSTNFQQPSFLKSSDKKDDS